MRSGPYSLGRYLASRLHQKSDVPLPAVRYPDLMSKFRRIMLPLALLAALAPAQAAPPTSYQGPVYGAGVPNVKVVRPLWTLTVDKAEYGDRAVLLAENRVLVKVGGALQARDVATGRVRWTLRQPGNLGLADKNAVFLTSGQILSAYRLSDGRRLWTRDLGGAVRDVGESGGVPYATTEHGGIALSAATGQTRWAFKEHEMTGFRTVLGDTGSGGVVFWDAYQGEPHFPATYAFDGATGKQLYRLGGRTGPLGVRGKAVLMADTSFIGSDDNATLTWVNLRSGVTEQVLKLAADFRCPGRGTLERRTSETFSAPPHIYVNDQCGTRLRQFWANDPALAGKTPSMPLPPARTFAVPDDGRFRLGPVGELLVFESRMGEVRLIPTTGRAPINYNGVDMPTGTGLVLPGAGPVSRLDALGSVLYVGRVNGEFLAYDAAKKKPLYAAQLPWRGFGPTFRSGKYAVLTTPGALAVVREP